MFLSRFADKYRLKFVKMWSLMFLAKVAKMSQKKYTSIFIYVFDLPNSKYKPYMILTK